MELWETLQRPGYFGKHRDSLYKAWDDQFGQGRWRIVWKVGNIYADFAGVCAVYEDAYFEFLKNNDDVLNQLVSQASEVYDDEPSNVNCGFDYSKQETSRTHIQDIAIRRTLLRMGVWFRGDQLIRIRQEKGTHPLSIRLSPGRVLFHRPDWIVSPELEGWWYRATVEAFYQSNKFIQILRKDS